MSVDFTELIKLYEDKKQIHGTTAYRHLSKILSEVKEIHKKKFQQDGKKKDHEQSWKAVKGHILEKLIRYIIKDSIEVLGLTMISGKQLEKQQLSKILAKVKRNILVDYGEYGMHLPDADLVIYDPLDGYVVAILSIKSTLRERIAQTGYWKLKLSISKITEDIKVYFVTLDEDSIFKIKDTPKKLKEKQKKGRAIAEVDTDGSYIMTMDEIEESNHVKQFSELTKDIKLVLDIHKKNKNISNINR